MKIVYLTCGYCGGVNDIEGHDHCPQCKGMGKVVVDMDSVKEFIENQNVECPNCFAEIPR